MLARIQYECAYCHKKISTPYREDGIKLYNLSAKFDDLRSVPYQSPKEALKLELPDANDECPHCRRKQGWSQKSVKKKATFFVLLFLVILWTLGVLIGGLMPIELYVGLLSIIGICLGIVIIKYPLKVLINRIRNGSIKPENLPVLVYSDDIPAPGTIHSDGQER